MKKLLIALGVIIVLLIAAVLVIPAFIPIDTYKNEIQSQVSEKTGRDFSINGEVSVSLFPNVALEVNDVVFGNAEGGRSAEMASLKQLQIDVQLFPLISGELAIDRFVLIDPRIDLEVLPDGTPNWQFAGMGEGQASDGSSGGGPGLSEIRLGDVRLENGQITYFDATSGVEHVISNVNMSMSLPSLDDPFKADGALTWQGEEIAIALAADRLRPLMEGGGTGVNLNVAANPITLDYTGQLTGGPDGSASGGVSLMVPSVRGLAAWVGNPMPEGNGFGPLSITGQLDAAAGRASFADASIGFDEIKGTGEVAIDTSAAVPVVTGRLDLEQLDLNPYLPPAAEGESEAAGPGEWSDDPLDFDVLKTFNADLSMSVQGIKAQNITIGRSALTMKVSGGKLVADLVEMALYEGQGTGRVTLDASGGTPAIAKTFNLSGVQAEPLLRDATGNDRLSGTGNLSLDVTASGGSQRQMVQNLNGNGAFDFRDGALKGVNLGAMIRNVTTAFLDSSAGEAQKTDFSELTATFVIKNGILSNNDLTMASPLFRVTGAGTSDLPARTVDYRVEPKLVASTEGQGGSGDLKGIVVPIMVTGPWHDISYAPDLAAAIDPTALLEGGAGAVEGVVGGAVEGVTGGVGGAVEGVTGGLLGGGSSGDSATGGVGGLLGGGSSGDSTTGEGDNESDGGGVLEGAGDAVKGLFGGGN